MHELDLALHHDTHLGPRTILPVLLDVDHNFSKEDRLAEYRQTWQRFSQLSGKADAADVIDRWQHNLQQLEQIQAITAPACPRSDKDWESKLAPSIVAKVQQHIAAVLAWREDQLQPQQRHCNVHNLLPDHAVVNTAAFDQLTRRIEAACHEQQQKLNPAAAAAASAAGGGAAAAGSSTAGSGYASSRMRAPPPVVQLLGMAGMGKSVLALQVAQHFEDTGGWVGGWLMQKCAVPTSKLTING